MPAEYLDPSAHPDTMSHDGRGGAEAFAVVDPVTDLSGDGIADSVMLERADGGLALLSDLDGNGYADHISTIDQDGRCVAWQLTSGIDGGWHVTDEGHL